MIWCCSQIQLERSILNIRSKDDPMDKYTYLNSLQGRNERLFYRCGHWLTFRAVVVNVSAETLDRVQRMHIGRSQVHETGLVLHKLAMVCSM